MESWAGDDDGDDGSDDGSHLVSWAGSGCMSFSQAFPAEEVALSMIKMLKCEMFWFFSKVRLIELMLDEKGLESESLLTQGWGEGGLNSVPKRFPQNKERNNYESESV